jgi:hypothetical protein
MDDVARLGVDASRRRERCCRCRGILTAPVKRGNADTTGLTAGGAARVCR